MLPKQYLPAPWKKELSLAGKSAFSDPMSANENMSIRRRITPVCACIAQSMNKMCPVQVWSHWPFPLSRPSELKHEFLTSSDIFSRVSSSTWCSGDKHLLIPSLTHHPPPAASVPHWITRLRLIPAGASNRPHCSLDHRMTVGGRLGDVLISLFLSVSLFLWSLYITSEKSQWSV